MFDFKNLQQLLNHFSDERVCRNYLEKQLWNSKPVCPHFGCANVYKLTITNSLSVAIKKGAAVNLPLQLAPFTKILSCRYPHNLPLTFLATSHKKGVSSCQLARDLAITQHSAWFVLHRVREMIKAANDTVLSNNIQIDETYYKGEAN